jgi:hypothetical protein
VNPTEVLAAFDRLAAADMAVALHLARQATSTEVEAYELLTQAADQVERLVTSPGFKKDVTVLAAALLDRRELSGADIDRLLGPSDGEASD